MDDTFKGSRTHLFNWLLFREGDLGVPVPVLGLAQCAHINAKEGAIIPTKRHVLPLSPSATCCESHRRQ